MKGIEIDTERLLLRTVRAGDAAAYYGCRSLPEVRRYQGCPKSRGERGQVFTFDLLVLDSPRQARIKT